MSHRVDLPWLSQYDALVNRVALLAFDQRTQVEVGGADRAAFLHNLCTNEIRKMPLGSGCEAFLTNVQGKTLAHVFILAAPKSMIIDTVGGQGETITKHLDHYLVSEQVVLADRSHEWSESLLAGPNSEELLARLSNTPMPPERLSHAGIKVAGKSAWARRVDVSGPVGFLISARRDDMPTITAALHAAGASGCDMAAFEAARIERGFPLFGPDISDKNLPQEVGRDELAISFVKGCYLGQETVARIDALGHVNRVLVGVRFLGETVCPGGTQLLSGGQSVGQVTSASWSPRLQAPLALGYVRRGFHESGTRLSSASGEAEVVKLPLA